MRYEHNKGDYNATNNEPRKALIGGNILIEAALLEETQEHKKKSPQIVGLIADDVLDLCLRYPGPIHTRTIYIYDKN